MGVVWIGKDRNALLYCPGITAEAREALPKEITLITLKQVLVKIELKDTITIIAGSLRFIEHLVSSSNKAPLLRTIAVIPYNRFRKRELQSAGLKWIKIAHAGLGGVSTSAWSVGFPKRLDLHNLSELSPSHGISRSLRHIIKDGESGKVIPAPVSSKLDELLHLDEVAVKTFDLPCYKACTGWVNRKLTPFEIGLMFDFNELVLKKLLSLINSSDKLIPLILSSVPGKLTQLMHFAIVKFWYISNVEAMQENQIVIKDKLVDRNIEKASTIGNLILKDPSLEDAIRCNEADRMFLEKEAEYLISYGQKAAKSDDATVPIELWDRCVLRHHFTWLDYNPVVASALKIIRDKFAMRIYLINLRKSFLGYLRRTYLAEWWKKLSGGTSAEVGQLRKDLAVGVDSLIRCIRSSWWDWTDGSTCHFWRWPSEIRRYIRDGFPVFVEKKLPEYKKNQTFRGLTTQQMEALEIKINKVIERRYLNEGYVKSLINYFAVPKGMTDIRVVYDGTKSGLTEAVWAPNFFMPSVDSLLLYSSAKTWWSDLDLGEMFLNYYMDPSLRPFCGVDVSQFVGTSTRSARKWLQWNRIFMGFRSSPYYAVKAFSWCLDIVRGNPKDPANPFSFDSVEENLPGSVGYDPQRPWLVKKFGETVANEIIVYMDDGRPHGESEIGCRKAGKRTSKVTQHLGQQDAARKYRPPSQQPGPWCGAFVAERDGSLWAYVSDEKWQKAKTYLNTWLEEIENCKRHSTPPVLDFKLLERGRGFLVYISRTYPSIVPYLKGLHLTLDSWRANRDSEGWKIAGRKISSYESDEDEIMACLDKHGNINSFSNDYKNHPEKVSLAPRFYDDVNALSLFFKSEKPSWRFVRGKEICVVEYGFGDASGSGFGASFETGGGIKFVLGVWGKDVGGESSNFRELANLVDALRYRSQDKNMSVRGLEVFLFTDNAVAEGAFYKGSSSSKKLFNLILQLRLLEMEAGMRIHIIHIAGSRMIKQGTDGLSRGDANEGVMQGSSMLSFVPIAKTCLERSPALLKKLECCLKPYLACVNQNLHCLSIKDWFLRAHDIVSGSYNSEGLWIPKYKSGTYLWVPAPAAGQHAIEQLRQARLKRTESTHLFLIPRIFTSLWRKQLYKVADLVVELPFDSKYWIETLQHEPLTFAFIFPFIPQKPWQLKRTYALLGMGRLLRSLWKENPLSTWDILQQFLSWTGRIFTMPEGMVWKMLQSSSSFKFLH